MADTSEIRHLTNFEVLQFVQLKKRLRDFQAQKAGTDRAATEGKRPQKDLEREMEVSWVIGNLRKYLLASPTAFQTRSDLGDAMALLGNASPGVKPQTSWTTSAGKINPEAVISNIRLSEAQKAMLLNAAPVTASHVSACLGARLPLKPSSRLPADDFSSVAEALATVLPNSAEKAKETHLRRKATADKMVSDSKATAEATTAAVTAAHENCPAVNEFIGKEAARMKREKKKEREDAIAAAVAAKAEAAEAAAVVEPAAPAAAQAATDDATLAGHKRKKPTA